MYNVINSFVMLALNYRSNHTELFSENFLKIHHENSCNRVLLYKERTFERLLSQELHRTKEGLHKGSFLVIFMNFFRIAFQQNQSGWLLSKFCKICEDWCFHFSSFKKTLHWRII